MSSHTGKAIEARRVSGSLVAAFHKANPPLIWRFDLTRNHSFTLLLRKEADQWVMGLAPTENEFHPVARFSSQADAEEAFTTIERILATAPYAWLKKTLKIIGIVAAASVAAVFLFLAGLWGYEVIRGLNAAHTAYQSPAFPKAPAAVPQLKPGVPLPADEYLKPPP